MIHPIYYLTKVQDKIENFHWFIRGEFIEDIERDALARARSVAYNGYKGEIMYGNYTSPSQIATFISGTIQEYMHNAAEYIAHKMMSDIDEMLYRDMLFTSKIRKKLIDKLIKIKGAVYHYINFMAEWEFNYYVDCTYKKICDEVIEYLKSDRNFMNGN